MNAEVARLFIGLWPDESTRRALCAHRDAWQWPKRAAVMDDARLHATLHFLGDQPRELIAPLLQGLAALRFEPFTLNLTKTALWHGGIAVFEPDDVPPVLRALHQEAGQWLQSLGLAVETRPYRPHVTLARRAFGATPPTRVEPIVWTPARPVLVESERGPPARYRVLN
jgi:2'-5' RNA ligase